MLFRSSILHGFGHGGEGFGGGGFGSGGFGDRPVEETVINNDYDDPGHNPGEERERGREASFDDRGDDRYDDRGAQFNDASYDTIGSQDIDDSDTGSYDDSGDDSNVI